MVKLISASIGILLLVAALVLFSQKEARAQDRSADFLCDGMSDVISFDQSRAFIQYAQGFLTGRIDVPAGSACETGPVIGVFDDAADVQGLYDAALEARLSATDAETMYGHDVALLLRLNLECDADAGCWNDRIERLSQDGLDVQTSLVFCGFDDLAHPDPQTVSAMMSFRRPKTLPFLCDELLDPTAPSVSDAWRDAAIEFFDARFQGDM